MINDVESVLLEFKKKHANNKEISKSKVHIPSLIKVLSMGQYKTDMMVNIIESILFSTKNTSIAIWIAKALVDGDILPEDIEHDCIESIRNYNRISNTKTSKISECLPLHERLKVDKDFSYHDMKRIIEIFNSSDLEVKVVDDDTFILLSDSEAKENFSGIDYSEWLSIKDSVQMIGKSGLMKLYKLPTFEPLFVFLFSNKFKKSVSVDGKLNNSEACWCIRRSGVISGSYSKGRFYYVSYGDYPYMLYDAESLQLKDRSDANIKMGDVPELKRLLNHCIDIKDIPISTMDITFVKNFFVRK